MKNVIIRNEQKDDYRIVEELTGEAFWNLHYPGCDEHYLVHKIRSHIDFIPELDFVAEFDGKIVGNIIYTKSKLIDEDGLEREILTFGPISIHPKYQRQGIGKALLNYSFDKAMELGYEESPAYEVDEVEAELFDKQFEYKEKEYRESQEEFYIYCNSSIRS